MEGEIKKEVDKFESFVVQAKEVNNARVFKFFLEKHQANIWKAWYNVIQDIKLKKAKTVEFHHRQQTILKVQTINRWQAQFSKTRKCRAKTSNLERQFRFKYYMATF